MGHAGAIIAGGKGTAQEKMDAMRKAGIHVVESPALIGEAMEKALKRSRKSKGKSLPRAKSRRRKRTAKQATGGSRRKTGRKRR